MSEISLSFTLTKREFYEFNRLMMKPAQRKKNIIFLLAYAAFCITFSLASEKPDYVVFISLAVLYGIVFAVNFIMNKRKIEKTYDKSPRLKAARNMEFFSDHLVEKNIPDENVRGISEVHYPFEAVKGVFETDDIYVFLVSPLEALLVPKRALNTEAAEKIGNLVKNLFAYKYKRF